MKSKILIMGLIASLYSFSAMANWFQVNAQVAVSNTVVSAAVENFNSLPMLCQGHATGLTALGLRPMAAANFVVYPGQVKWVYVYTSVPYGFFVDGWADIRCTTAF